MKLLVACELPDFALAQLRSLGNDIDYRPELTAEELPGALPEATGLVIGRLTVTPEAIAAGRKLQLIVRAGADVSRIAVEEASRQGVFVSRTPHRDAEAVAEMAMLLLLALDRSLTAGVAAGRSAARPDVPRAWGLSGRTLGLIGYGPVQREVASRARAFGMNVVVAGAAGDETAPTAPIQICAWPSDLGPRCDLMVAYQAPEESDERVLDRETIQGLRDGASVVYIGPLTGIDEAALLESAGPKSLRIAIDVLGMETSRDPGKSRSRLADHAGVLFTQRLARKTRQAENATAAEVVRIIRDFLVTGLAPHSVNLLDRSPATWQLVLRLKDAVGVLAGIMEAIRADGVNAEEISTRVFVGAHAAWGTIALDERPSLEALEAIRKLPGVLHLELRAVV